MLDIQFFATPGDLAPGWNAVKNIVDFKFAKQGYRDNASWPIFRNLLDIPELGKASSGRISGSGGYIILPQSEPLNIIKHRNDPTIWTVNKFTTEYYYSVHFLPDHRNFAFIYLGGLWMEENVINLIGYNMFYGDGDINSNNEFLEQYKLFAKSLFKGFKTVKIKQFGQWKVGPEAYEMFQNGTRLIAYDADLSFDNNYGAADPTIYK